ncbi:TDT family transporter [Methanobrevibacter sp.]|uniref:TDT family transporter n=1 Tax=Methanobrevibacter sp. TaxID=66852 RepID=UPI0025EA4BDD|nr:TDT family transporter [Methanobrevibacter sp.]MBQ2666204.1 TDT family transporter [Methanobrevibacter sp.]
MKIIRKLPIPISGLILALLSLGNLVQDIHPYLRYIFAAIGAIFLILIILKVVLYPQSIKEDFKNPIIVSSSGTFSMSLMLLSTYLASFTPRIGYALWIIGIVLHISLIIYFTYHFIIRRFDISAVYPTYWIVFVGITMASITGHYHGLYEIDFIFFIAGFIGMLISTPLVLYREFVYKKIPDMNKPLTCIFTALFSILIFGYLNSAPSISNEFVMGMYVLACAFYIFSIYKMISFRNLDFYPSFSAFTFPFVISALATKGVSAIWTNNITDIILIIETTVAIVIVVYILMKYIRFLKNS